jgi:uncharacterized phage protein (TIGR01671 family)
MMREILFRGKMIANGNWSEGNLLVTKEGCCITPDATVLGSYGAVDPETVGQYTGLTDKNGTKIFEGDIVAFNYTADELTNCEILWFKNKWVVRERVHYAINDIDSFFCGRSTVIGNIYDNPELLKGENND